MVTSGLLEETRIFRVLSQAKVRSLSFLGNQTEILKVYFVNLIACASCFVE